MTFVTLLEETKQTNDEQLARFIWMYTREFDHSHLSRCRQKNSLFSLCYLI